MFFVLRVVHTKLVLKEDIIAEQSVFIPENVATYKTNFSLKYFLPRTCKGHLDKSFSKFRSCILYAF